MVNSSDDVYVERIPVGGLDIYWLCGIVISSLCLLVQFMFFVLVTKSRGLDEKLLCQISVARLGNIICEFTLLKEYYLESDLSWKICRTVYFTADTAMIIWTFIFTKNLYDNVVQVFNVKKRNFIVLSVMIWLLSVMTGLLVEFELDYLSWFIFISFVSIKLCILVVNMFFLCRIFYVALDKNNGSNRKLMNILKICVVSLILVCISSLQALVTIVLTEVPEILMFYTYCEVIYIINSYQVLAITILFVILVKNKVQSSLLKTASMKFNDLVN